MACPRNGFGAVIGSRTSSGRRIVPVGEVVFLAGSEDSTDLQSALSGKNTGMFGICSNGSDIVRHFIVMERIVTRVTRCVMLRKFSAVQYRARMLSSMSRVRVESETHASGSVGSLNSRSTSELLLASGKRSYAHDRGGSLWFSTVEFRGVCGSIKLEELRLYMDRVIENIVEEPFGIHRGFWSMT